MGSKNKNLLNKTKIKAIEPYTNGNILSDLQHKKDQLLQKSVEVKLPKNQIYSNLNTLRQLHDKLHVQINQEHAKIQKIKDMESFEKELAIKMYLLEHAKTLVGRQGFLGSIFDEILLSSLYYKNLIWLV